MAWLQDIQPQHLRTAAEGLSLHESPGARGKGFGHIRSRHTNPKKEGELDPIPSSQDEFNSTSTYLMPLTGSWGQEEGFVCVHSMGSGMGALGLDPSSEPSKPQGPPRWVMRPLSLGLSLLKAGIIRNLPLRVIARLGIHDTRVLSTAPGKNN